MAASGPKRDLNLNTVAHGKYSWRKNIPRKNYEHFHHRGDIKIVGKETDMQECRKCHKLLLLVAFTPQGLRSDGAYRLRKICRQCATVDWKESYTVRKNAPPKPERCQRCHKKEEKLQGDHIHGSTTFRGWLCSPCNTAIGKLGDNLEGVLQAAVYLENDKDKIIETLHKVYNEMFARTG